MSKSKNIKRAKLLWQKKRERDKQMLLNEQLEKDKLELRKKAAKDGFTIVERSALGLQEKISTALLDMIKHILLIAQDEEDAKGIVSMGVVAWNCGIIKEIKGEAELKKLMKSFKSTKNIEKNKLLNEFIHIKCTQYKQYNDFITDFRLSFEHDGRMNFTVLTGVTNDTEQHLK